MGRPELPDLRELDARVVPAAARRLRGAVEAARARRAAAAARLSTPLPESVVPEPLRRLDHRLVDRGPLGWLARSPQYAALALAAVLLAGSSVALTAPEDLATPTSVEVVGSAPGTLGPQVGADVQEYLAAARRAAVEASRERPDEAHVALVHLAEHAPVGRVAPLLEGLEVLRAYLSVPGEQDSEVLAADVADLEADLAVLFTATAERKAEDAAELRQLAEVIEPTDEQQQEFRQFYVDAAATAAREAQAYGSGCACLFAVVVRGPASLLAALPALQGVRGVELAAPDAELAALRISPLAPEQTGVVQPDAVPRPPS